MMEHLAPGEKEAIEKAVQIGELYGFGNLIAHLKGEWAKKLLTDGWVKDQLNADRCAGHICVWCDVDQRTGTKVKKENG